MKDYIHNIVVAVVAYTLGIMGLGTLYYSLSKIILSLLPIDFESWVLTAIRVMIFVVSVIVFCFILVLFGNSDEE